MSDVTTQEPKKQSWLATAGIVVGTAFALFSVIPAVISTVPVLATLAGIGVGAYAVSTKERREATKNHFKTVGKAYANAWSNISNGWKKAVAWAETREAAAKAKAQAPEANGGTSPLASKEAAPGFNASVSGEKPAATHVPAPKPQPAAAPRM